MSEDILQTNFGASGLMFFTSIDVGDIRQNSTRPMRNLKIKVELQEILTDTDAGMGWGDGEGFDGFEGNEL